MAGNITFTLIKPGTVNSEHLGTIITKISNAGFRIAAMKYTKLTPRQAEVFYSVHKNKEFFNDLIDYMTSGPIVAMILEKENAVEDYRKLIGNTDPDKAEDGTIRKLFAKSIQRNAVHGSDSDKAAQFESDFFFSKSERYSREGFCFIE